MNKQALQTKQKSYLNMSFGINPTKIFRIIEYYIGLLEERLCGSCLTIVIALKNWE